MTILNLDLATPPKVNPGTVQILRPPAMIQPRHLPEGNRLRRNGQAGQSERIFSSHSPITMTVTEVD